jgi:multiple sugar transport system ATP-binding protein
MSDVNLVGVRKSFGHTEVVKGIDLSIPHREFVVFVGPSGCGKSTLLRLIAGLEEITAGDVLIDGQRVNDTPASDRGLAMVFQSYALYPHMTVFENMSFGLRINKTDRETIRRKVNEAARILRLEELLHRRPRELSGGQRQRVAIGRAIVRNPRVFLFDEPLSNLDASLRVQMRIEIARLHQQLDATMIYVTHDQVEAMTMADKIVVLNGGQIEQVGSPLELYHHPRNLFVAGFIGSPKMNFLKGQVEAIERDQVQVGLPCGTSAKVRVRPDSAKPGDKVTLGIRPEHIRDPRESTDQSKVEGDVLVVERLGGETFAYLRLLDETVLTVQMHGDNPVQPQDHISVGFPTEACHLFDAAGQAIERPERHPLADRSRAPGAESAMLRG